jgi:hypothetical protein
MVQRLQEREREHWWLCSASTGDHNDDDVLTMERTCGGDYG